MTIKCWIIDDEPAAHKGIEIALQRHEDFSVIFHGYSVDKTLLTNDIKPDVIFLDIEMPAGNGFELLKRWQGQLPQVVFITAYNHYAIQAFDHNALDYLLKPIEQSRFDAMTDKVRQRINEKNLILKQSSINQFYQQIQNLSSVLGLSVKTTDGLFHLKQKDIIYIESVNDHLAFHYADKVLIARDSFKRLITELDPQFFIRTHKSYVVNTSHVVKIEKGRFGDGTIELSNYHQVKMSRRYKAILTKFTPS